MKLFGASLCLMMVLMSLGQEASAATADFSVRTFVGNDNIPPTTPSSISADPVAPTQINITWAAATDDVMLSGYRLFRNAVQIATTTLFTFSDTGLTPSTTYSYYVDAFDSFGNYSSSSVLIATTTPPLPPLVATSTPTTTSASPNDATRMFMAQNILVTPKENSALFTWNTNTQTQYFLAWGRTTAYELGTVSGIIFNKNHSTSITMLEPGTVYFYKLVAIDAFGVSRVIATNTFTTVQKIFTDTIPNVAGFSATANNSDVNLLWRNTFTDPNLKVRIVRSHLFYPSHVQDGAVVYEGNAQFYKDKEALATRSPLYYTIFVLGEGNKSSSGAIARVFKTTTTLNTENNGTNGASGTPMETSPKVITPTEIDEGDPAVLTARAVSILQRNATFGLDTTLTLDYQLPYIIQTPKNAVAPNLKTITVSILNPSNQREVSAYLLKLNPAGDAYEALILAPQVIGSSRILIEVFDYEKQTVRRISTAVNFVSTAPSIPFFPDQMVQYAKSVLPAIAIVVCGYIFFIVFKRRLNV